MGRVLERENHYHGRLNLTHILIGADCVILS
jgi:hypothetical protein